MLDLSEDLKKVKTKVLLMSGISLFIALTRALPQKVSIIGLDLSKNETMAGWFILAITAYFLANFIILSVFEIIRYYLPTLIGRKTDKTTGSVIGLTKEECFKSYVENDYEPGTLDSELNDIKIKNQEITYNYKKNFVRVKNFAVLAIDILFPTLLSITSLIFLHSFLRSQLITV